MKYPAFIETNQIVPENPEVLEQKVDALLAAMTTEEKMNLCHGDVAGRGAVGNGGYNHGVPRLGVPEIRMYDGPAGVTSIYETTGLPIQSMLAATWSPELAYDFGKIAGSENYAISGNTQLGSEFDIVRVPQFGRNRDMLGEDPFLLAALCAPETRGIQDNHVAATIKHFAVCSQDTVIQNAPNQIVDEQALHEIYFAGFEAAVKDGGAASIMCSYNRFNGEYASGNVYAQKKVLRDMWNFKGYVMSDWGSNHALTTHKGMDMEMPNGTYNSNERLRLALKKGRLSMADIDAAARHVLYAYGLVGYLNLVALDENGNVIPEEDRTEPIHIRDSYRKLVAAGLLDENAAICQSIIRKGAVLLKNDEKTLPLKPSDYSGNASVAMIGLGAVRLIAGTGQERSYGLLSRMKAPAEELRRLAGEDANIEAAVAIDTVGHTIPGKYLFQDETLEKNGLVRTWGVSDTGEGFGMFGESGEKEPADGPTAIGGAGVEFKGVAAADDDEDRDVMEFRPGMTSGIVIDVAGHDTGSFCAIDEVINFTTGTIDGKVNQTYKNAADGTAFTKDIGFTWNGYLSVPEDGEYDLILQAIGGNAELKIKLDGEHWNKIGGTEMREGAHWPWGNIVCSSEGMDLSGRKLVLKAGVAYPIQLMGRAGSAEKDLQLRLAWITPRQRAADYSKALSLAAKADKVVLFLSYNYAYHSEHWTPSFGAFPIQLPTLELAAEQRQLLYDVKAAMRPDAKLVVVDNNGDVMCMPWHDQVDAILKVFTPGQEGGTPIAELLLGKINPSGKMAVTIPEKETDTLVTDTAEHRVNRYESYVGVDGKPRTDHDEGIFTGYRWYDKEKVKPLFAFGHGISYTQFAYSDLRIDAHEVTFTVTNIGEKTGTEIAQVYLGAGDVPATIQMAEKQLCGFARLEDITPGESRTVTITIPERSFCYWNPFAELTHRADGTADKWKKTVGMRKVMVGTASDRLSLFGEVLA